MTAGKRRAPSSSSTSTSSQVTLSKKEYEHLLAVSGRYELKASRAEQKLKEATVERAKLQEDAESARREARCVLLFTLAPLPRVTGLTLTLLRSQVTKRQLFALRCVSPPP